MAGTHRGFFLIADISGYSAYLSDSELEHAQDVLTSLMEVLIDHTKPPLVISRLAGDAVISYTNDKSDLGGQAFVEMIEATYVAFRRAMEFMVLNTTCQCNACANINTLDLKFFVHHGSYALQKLGTHEELIGEDVNTAFRLMKNNVVNETGLSAYTMYTAPAIASLALPGFAESLVPHSESFESTGLVDAFIQDMHTIYEERRESDPIVIAPDEVLVQVEHQFSVPVEILWDAIGRPEHRAIFLNAKRQDVQGRSGGRIAAGTVYECVHNNDSTSTQTVIGWHPFEQITTEETAPLGLRNTVTIRLRTTPGGSAATVTFGKMRGSWLRASFANPVFRYILERNVPIGLETLAAELTAEPRPIDLTGGPRMTPDAIREAVASSIRD